MYTKAICENSKTNKIRTKRTQFQRFRKQLRRGGKASKNKRRVQLYKSDRKGDFWSNSHGLS